MDDYTFKFVSIVAAAGGALGTLVGYNKLRRERNAMLVDRDTDGKNVNITNSELSQVEKSVVATHHDNLDRKLRCANDFARTIGYLGMHTLFGMILYPLMPVYFLGGTLKKEFWNSTVHKKEWYK